ncbi:MAG: cyclohexadieny/prephenate dehydrogenase [Cellvibrionaceae bacterium]|jgi:cyclohexadieny/prephenate dehydrogenase
MNTKSPRKLVIIGLGLIGGSLAAAIKKHQWPWEIIAVVRRQETADFALTEKIIDRAVFSLEEIAQQLSAGDMIFIAVPTLSVSATIQQVFNLVDPAVTITDAASVKGNVVKAVEKAYGQLPPQFVPGHPIAGSEKSGVSAANPELYVNHHVILTPTEHTAESHLQRVAALWRSVGADVLRLPVEEHDQILAATSHLPHAIAYSLVDTLANDAKNENIFRYAAGGFRDFTRIAGSDPVMWHDIMCANRDHIVSAIDLFQENLSNLRQAIVDKDGPTLLKIFSRAKIARDEFSTLLNNR